MRGERCLTKKLFTSLETYFLYIAFFLLRLVHAVGVVYCWSRSYAVNQLCWKRGRLRVLFFFYGMQFKVLYSVCYGVNRNTCDEVRESERDR